MTLELILSDSQAINKLKEGKGKKAGKFYPKYRLPLFYNKTFIPILEEIWEGRRVVVRKTVIKAQKKILLHSISIQKAELKDPFILQVPIDSSKLLKAKPSMGLAFIWLYCQLYNSNSCADKDDKH